jgi:hypothetical protein
MTFAASHSFLMPCNAMWTHFLSVTRSASQTEPQGLSLLECSLLLGSREGTALLVL